MTDWITNEDGSRTFGLDGWTVQVFPSDFHTRIAVRSPRYPVEDVQVDSTGIWVRGELGPEHVPPPWPVIVAIAEARAIVG